jgi:hypothetical protein
MFGASPVPRTASTGSVTELAFPKRAGWLAPAALAVALLSLALNGVLLYVISRPERLLAPTLDRVLTRLEAEDATLKYQVRIPAGMPVHFDIPVDERYEVRLNTTLPINTTVNLPIQTPFGSRTVTVPIRTSIPIRQTVPFHLRDTFRLRTQTQAEIVVPLEIPIRDLPLDALRQSLKP